MGWQCYNPYNDGKKEVHEASFLRQKSGNGQGRKLSDRLGLDEFMELDKGEGRNEREQTGPD